MKKLLFTLFGIIVFFCAMSQDVINIKNSNSVIKCKIDSVNKIERYVYFTEKNEKKRMSFDYIKYFIKDEVESKIVKKTTLQDDLYNNNVKKDKSSIDTKNINYNIVTLTPTENENSSYFLIKASNNLIAGFMLGIGGSIISSTSIYVFPVKYEYNLDKNKTPRDIATYTGIAMGIFGIVEVIIGADQIGKAGIALDKERKIFMSPSKSGVGLEIKF